MSHSIYMDNPRAISLSVRFNNYYKNEANVPIFEILTQV